jgi:3-oxoacyl-[acyl-carrier-protein] synthase II
MWAMSAVISAWSAISAYGIGRDEFIAGLRAGRCALTPLDRETWATPLEQAAVVPGSDARDLLGPRGTRSMDRVTALAVLAVGCLVDAGSGSRLPGVDESTALVLGTSIGSVRSIVAFTRDSFTQQKPFFVDPARFPNTMMNCAAGRSAIWHGLRGPNATVAGGRAAALLALNYAWRLQRAGRAGAVICGAAEELSPERAWIEWHARRDGEPAPVLGEGCAVVLLEAGARDGRSGLAELLAVEIGFSADAGEVVEALSGCLRRALGRVGIGPEVVWAVAPSASARGGEQEGLALDAVLGCAERRELRCAELLGDTNAAAGAFQLAAVLAAAEGAGDAAGRVAIVTSVDRDGVVGCALLRITHRECRG